MFPFVISGGLINSKRFHSGGNGRLTHSRNIKRFILLLKLRTEDTGSVKCSPLCAADQ